MVFPFAYITRNSTIALSAFSSIVLYTIAYFFSDTSVVRLFLLVVLVPGALFLWWDIISEMRKGNFGVDIIAGVALVTALVLGQYLAGVVVLLMLSGGQTLEEYAMRRARRDISSLLSRVPEYAHVQENTSVLDVRVVDVPVGAYIMVKPGEVIPLDGVVTESTVFIDESSLTGEPIPVEKNTGMRVHAGTLNTTHVLHMRVDTLSADSAYSRIIRLVQEAEESRSPMVRMADRYSVYFTAITFFIAGVAWFISYDPVRVLAVLVVATPCPLILATPIAFVSGMSKAAGRGLIVKGGQSLEIFARARTFIFDKTGTLTLGEPRVHEVYGDTVSEYDVRQLAGSLDQLSSHVLARAIVSDAKKHDSQLVVPEQFNETFGHGVTGVINGTSYFLGKFSFIQEKTIRIPDNIVEAHERYQEQGVSVVFLANEKLCIGYIVITDELRPDSKNLFTQLRRDGIEHIVMLTGDKQKPAHEIASLLGITTVHAECSPEEKIMHVRAIPEVMRPSVMVGDGINDAPALAAADVGVALGTQGVTATSDSADVVLLTPEISRLRDLRTISQRTVSIAREGIFIGMALSIVAMAGAMGGFVTPVVGALLQEVIDVVVIINALRVVYIRIAVS